MALVHDDDLTQFSALGDDTVSGDHTVDRWYYQYFMPKVSRSPPTRCVIVSPQVPQAESS
jgi:hypothetical protein